MKELVTHHVTVISEVAPEHVDDGVLKLMKKPRQSNFLDFKREFEKSDQGSRQRTVLGAVSHFVASRLLT